MIRNKRNLANTMSAERRGSNRRKNLFRPHTYVGEHSAQNERCVIYEIFEKKSNLMIYPKWVNMKFAYRNREFWYKG